MTTTKTKRLAPITAAVQDAIREHQPQRPAFGGEKRPGILHGLTASGLEPINEEVADRIRFADAHIRNHLIDILYRAADLLDAMIDPQSACHTVRNIADGSGASGPIGSKWEKVVHEATTLETLLMLGVRPVPVEDDDECICEIPFTGNCKWCGAPEGAE